MFLLCILSHPQGLSGPRWQQLASRPLSLSSGLCGSESPPARADSTFKVTMVPGDGVGPELMTAVKDVFKVKLKVLLSFRLNVVDGIDYSFIDVIQKC